jgi:hypothetical protein
LDQKPPSHHHPKTAGGVHHAVYGSIHYSTITLTDHSDRIAWKWTANGLYSAASAYECQFKGAITYFPATDVWKANTDPKCRFFAWLILHNRAQTADILAKKNCPHNPSCSLCFCLPETVEHLFTQCNFVEAVWQEISNHHGLPDYQSLAALGGPAEWVIHLTSGNKKERRSRAGVLFAYWWHLWERNRRIFDFKELSVPRVVSLIQEHLIVPEQC